MHTQALPGVRNAIRHATHCAAPSRERRRRRTSSSVAMWRSSGPKSALKARCQARPCAAAVSSPSAARRSAAYSARSASWQNK